MSGEDFEFCTEGKHDFGSSLNLIHRGQLENTDEFYLRSFLIRV